MPTAESRSPWDRIKIPPDSAVWQRQKAHPACQDSQPEYQLAQALAQAAADLNRKGLQVLAGNGWVVKKAFMPLY